METQLGNDELEAPVVSYEGMVLESAVNENDNYVLFSIQKMWFKGEPRIIADNYAGGFVLTPPYGKEILVALSLEPFEDTTLPKDVLAIGDFDRIIERFVRSTRMIRLEAESKPGGF